MRAAFLILIEASLALAQGVVSQNAAPQSAPPQNILQLSMKRAVEIALTPEGSPRVALAMESVKQARTGPGKPRRRFCRQWTVQFRNAMRPSI